MTINEQDLQWTTVRSGPQNDSFVKVTHMPTGMFGDSEGPELKARLEAYRQMTKLVKSYYNYHSNLNTSGT